MSADTGFSEGELDGVSDPSDINQKRRINLINDLREQFHEQYDKIYELLVAGQISDQLARKVLRQAVKKYALESEQIIRANLPDKAKDPREWTPEEEAAYEVWKERPLGSLEMHTDTEEFQGVREFLEAPRVFTDSWREQAPDPLGGSDEVVREERYEIPLEVSERAYRALNYFWFEFGLDVEMDKKLPHDKI